MSRNFEGARFAPCKCGYGLVSLEEFDDAHPFSREITNSEQRVIACPKCNEWPDSPQWGNLGRVGVVLDQRFKNVRLHRVSLRGDKIALQLFADGFQALNEIEIE